MGHVDVDGFTLPLSPIRGQKGSLRLDGALKGHWQALESLFGNGV